MCTIEHARVFKYTCTRGALSLHIHLACKCERHMVVIGLQHIIYVLNIRDY